MTVPAQVLAAVRSIPHPRQEPHMPAPAPSPAEQAVIDRFGIFAAEEDAARPAEPTGELRDELLRWLLVFTGRDHEPTDADRAWLSNEADALLSGPLADVVREAAEADKRLTALIAVRAKRDALLAKLRAVEALHVDFHGWCADCDFAWPCRTRRALDAS